MDHREQAIGEFLARIASENVTPAGGSGVAVAGAIGASLCEMACVHTLEDGAYDGVNPELDEIRDDLGAQREHLLKLADRDAAVVDDLFAADGDGNDRTARKRSVGVPLAIAESCSTVVERGAVAAEAGKPTTAPDAETGVCLARAALRASVFIVRRNVAQLSEEPFVERVARRATAIEESAERAFERTRIGAEAGE